MLNERQRERHEQDCKGYCRACTNAQLENVYHDEKQRARNNPDTETGEVAKIFAKAAATELERRGLR